MLPVSFNHCSKTDVFGPLIQSWDESDQFMLAARKYTVGYGLLTAFSPNSFVHASPSKHAPFGNKVLTYRLAKSFCGYFFLIEVLVKQRVIANAMAPNNVENHVEKLTFTFLTQDYYGITHRGFVPFFVEAVVFDVPGDDVSLRKSTLIAGKLLSSWTKESDTVWTYTPGANEAIIPPSKITFNMGIVVHYRDCQRLAFDLASLIPK